MMCASFNSKIHTTIVFCYTNASNEIDIITYKELFLAIDLFVCLASGEGQSSGHVTTTIWIHHMDAD